MKWSIKQLNNLCQPINSVRVIITFKLHLKYTSQQHVLRTKYVKNAPFFNFSSILISTFTTAVSYFYSRNAPFEFN